MLRAQLIAYLPSSSLADPETPRWISFSPPAVASGARAVFGFPLHVGAVRLGALNLYRDEPGSLTDDQHADALVMAEVAAHEVLAMQADAPSGALAARRQTMTSWPTSWCGVPSASHTISHGKVATAVSAHTSTAGSSAR